MAQKKVEARSCGTCRFLEVPLGADGLPKFKRNQSYQCLYKVLLPVLPVSITMRHDYHDPFGRSSRYAMLRTYGEDCPTWTARAGSVDA